MAISVTVDGLDTNVLNRLHAEAERRGVDVSTVVKEMIRDGLGRSPESAPAVVNHDLDALAGTWSADEAAAFLSSVAGLRQCDEELWK